MYEIDRFMKCGGTIHGTISGNCGITGEGEDN